MWKQVREVLLECGRSWTVRHWFVVCGTEAEIGIRWLSYLARFAFRRLMRQNIGERWVGFGEVRRICWSLILKDMRVLAEVLKGTES